ncbi:hypothetical protein ILYODFUR_027957 [Ilyodon furcidens]|uniref:Uncharacterized protein n=1 Tax=Ilyodon furcidens TaxID=33524 RepID=A0ABV0T176_9TELE
MEEGGHSAMQGARTRKLGKLNKEPHRYYSTVVTLVLVRYKRVNSTHFILIYTQNTKMGAQQMSKTQYSTKSHFSYSHLVKCNVFHYGKIDAKVKDYITST